MISAFEELSKPQKIFLIGLGIGVMVGAIMSMLELPEGAPRG